MAPTYKTCPFKTPAEPSAIVPATPHAFTDGSTIPADACTSRCGVAVVMNDESGKPLGVQCGLAMAGIGLMNLDQSLRAILAQAIPAMPQPPVKPS